jgi:hypothetical protein
MIQLGLYNIFFFFLLPIMSHYHSKSQNSQNTMKADKNGKRQTAVRIKYLIKGDLNKPFVDPGLSD